MKKWTAGRILALVVTGVFGFILLFLLIFYLRFPREPAPSGSESIFSEEPSLEPVTEEAVHLLVCGIDNTEQLTDVIMYVQFQVKDSRVRMLQIPRDTFIGGEYVTGKINSVYGHYREHRRGVQELCRIVEQNLSLPVDYYVTVTLEGFRDMVDSLGGVKMDVPILIDYLPGKQIQPGEQLLSGEQAEWLVRYRKGYASGDLGRVNTQALFLKALMRTVKDQGRMQTAQTIIQNYDKVDTDLPLSRMLSLANEAFQVKEEEIELFVLPGNGKMYLSFAVYEVARNALAEILNEHFLPGDAPITAEEIGFPRVPYLPPVSSEEPSQEESSGEDWEEYPEDWENSDSYEESSEIPEGAYPID